METIIAEPIRCDPKLSAEVGEAMQILSNEAGKYESIVSAEWSRREETSPSKEPIRLVLQFTEFPDKIDTLISLMDFEDPTSLRTRLHWIWTDVLAQYSRCLRRRTNEMLGILTEDSRPAAGVRELTILQSAVAVLQSEMAHVKNKLNESNWGRFHWPSFICGGLLGVLLTITVQLLLAAENK